MSGVSSQSPTAWARLKLTVTSGAGIVGWIRAAAGAIAQTVAQKLARRIDADDFATLQAAVDAAPSGAHVHFTDGAAYALTSAVILTKPVTLHGNGAIVTSTGGVFRMTDALVTASGRRVRILGFDMRGPASVETAVYVDNNNPFIEVCDNSITGFAAGIFLRQAYCSEVSRNRVASASGAGIQLHDGCHASTVENNFVDFCTIGIEVGAYSTATPTGNHSVRILGGAAQNCGTGIQLAGCYETEVSHVYHEGNENNDIRVGSGAGDYRYACYNTAINTPMFHSPCEFGGNCEISESVGTAISGMSTGGGAATAGYHVKIDGYSDKTSVEFRNTVSATPWNFPDSSDPSGNRVILTSYGRLMLPFNGANSGVNGPNSLQWVTLPDAAQTARQFAGFGFAGRKTLFVEALGNASDIQLRAKAGQGQVRFFASDDTEVFSVDYILNRSICYGTIKKRTYTVATLPAGHGDGSCAMVSDALAPAFGAAVVGGGAVVTPVFQGSGVWRVG